MRPWLALFALALLVSLIAGCTPVELVDVDCTPTLRGHIRAVDARSGDRWWKRAMAHPHRLTCYRDEAGKLHDPVNEQANGTDLLEDLSEPASWLNNHAAVTVP